MPKKKSSKKAKEVQENAAVKEEKPSSVSSKKPKEQQENTTVEEKPSSAKKECHNEIDDIFAGKKRKKPEIEKSKKPKLDASDRPMKMKMKRKKDENESKDSFADPPSRPRKKTGDGFTVYTEDELGVNNAEAGGTPLCPFDCSCCF